MTWRCIVDPPRTGAANMAMDQALFEGVQAGGRPVLRLYRWEPGCLSLGRNQTAIGVYDSARAADRGVDIVRRPTGGLAVFHHHELTYAVIATVRQIGRPRAAYEAINRALADGLARLGVPGAIASGAAPTPLSAARQPCFGEAAAGEVVVGGRKIVGSAARIERHTLLQHGSILLDGDQSEVTELQIPADASIRPAATALRDVLGRVPAWSELHDAVLAGFEATLGLQFERVRADAAACDRARQLEARFRSDAWTWRR